MTENLSRTTGAFSISRRARRAVWRASLISTVAVVMMVASCANSDEPTTASRQLLGTFLTITIHDPGYSTVVTDQVFERITEIERRMSTSTLDYQDTELLRVNAGAGGEGESVSPDTFAVVKRALEFAELTEGAFDPTIWPLTHLWKIGQGGDHVPPAGEIERARGLTDYRALTLHPATRTIRLDRARMGLDVGGIAKGYAADEAARMLREAGVEHALLDFGGNILTVGTKRDGSAWRIGIQRPDATRSSYLGVATVEDMAVVTSGPYERFFEQDGVRYHHILDSSTGYPTENGISQVTIITGRSIDADALSTATYVLGRQRGLELIESLPDTETVIVEEDHSVYLSSGAAAYFALTDESYAIVAPPASPR